MLLALQLNNLLEVGVEEEVAVSEQSDVHGTSRITHPWESGMSVSVAEIVRYTFPSNFGELKYIAYDNNPLLATDRKRIQQQDASYITREGKSFAYYRLDGVDNSYTLYPKPSVNWVNELEGENVAITISDDTEDGDEGTIAVRTGDGDTDIGASIDVMSTDNSVFMVYETSPTSMTSGADEPDFPDYLRKYIRYGVAARAYSANTDGRIKSLGDFWGMRYQLGITFIKRFMRLRRQDRDYRLGTKGYNPRRSRLPHLPDGYPAV